MTEKISLVTKMRTWVVDNPDHYLAAEMLAKAKALEDALADTPGPSNGWTKAFLGCWARARRLYCDATGEPLV